MDSVGTPPPSAEDAPPALGAKDWWPVLLVVALFLLFLMAVLLSWWPFSGMSWSLRSELGESFGVLSALFNGLAFAGLIITILIQSRELRLQRHQLSLQRTELQAQRAESKRLADAQEQQTLLNSISAFVAAETYSNRTNFGGPSPIMTEAVRYLTEHLKKEMERRKDSRAAPT
jgi:hypothetical protein